MFQAANQPAEDGQMLDKSGNTPGWQRTDDDVRLTVHAMSGHKHEQHSCTSTKIKSNTRRLLADPAVALTTVAVNWQHHYPNKSIASSIIATSHIYIYIIV